MIQDREVQALWDAVEEVRKRVEALEDNAPECAADLDYVASNTSNRKTFHLRGCKFTRGFMQASKGFMEFRSHDEAVEAGLVPCKTCGA